MRTVFFIPPLHSMSGGLANIFAVAVELADMGHKVALTCPGEAAGLADVLNHGAGNIALLPWEGLHLAPGDVWVVPESWPNALTVGVNSGAETVVYAQSWNFLLTTLPAGVRWKQLPVRYLAVSRPVAWFMESVLHLRVEGIVPPAVNPVFFARSGGAHPIEKPSGTGPVRVAWMPRKNKALAEQIQQVAEAVLQREPAPVRVEWVPVHRMSQEEMAWVFATCSLFLNTAFPEGFGLPPLEAMACGCVPVGFTGFGGRDYMRDASNLGGTIVGEAAHIEGMPLFSELPCSPLLPQSEQAIANEPAMPPGGNGFYYSDGDIMGAGLGLARAVLLAQSGGPQWEALRGNCLTTASGYTAGARKRRLEQLWPSLFGGA